MRKGPGSSSTMAWSWSWACGACVTSSDRAARMPDVQVAQLSQLGFLQTLIVAMQSYKAELRVVVWGGIRVGPVASPWAQTEVGVMQTGRHCTKGPWSMVYVVVGWTQPVVRGAAKALG